MGGGVWVGGSSAGWVGLKLWTPPPLIILRVFWVGLLPYLLSLVTGALSGCSHQRQQHAAASQNFHMADFFFHTMSNL